MQKVKDSPAGTGHFVASAEGAGRKAATFWAKKWFQFIKDNPDKPWSFYCLSQNSNITWDIVKDNPDVPWSFYSLSVNQMPVAKEKYIKKLTRSLAIISDWVFKLKTNPDYKLCRKWMAQITSKYYDSKPWKQ